MWHLLTLPNQLTYLHLFLFFHQVQLFGAFQMIWLLSQCNWTHSIKEFMSNLTVSKPVLSKRNITQTTYVIFHFLAATYEKVFKSLKSILIIYFILSSISEYSAKLSTNYFSFLAINLWVLPWYIPWLRKVNSLMHLLINKYLLNATVYQNHPRLCKLNEQRYAVMVFLFQWMIPFILESKSCQIFKSST